MTDPTKEEIDRVIDTLLRAMKPPEEVWTTEEFAREIAAEHGVVWAPDETNSQKIGKTMIHVL